MSPPWQVEVVRCSVEQFTGRDEQQGALRVSRRPMGGRLQCGLDPRWKFFQLWSLADVTRCNLLILLSIHLPISPRALQHSPGGCGGGSWCTRKVAWAFDDQPKNWGRSWRLWDVLACAQQRNGEAAISLSSCLSRVSRVVTFVLPGDVTRNTNCLAIIGDLCTRETSRVNVFLFGESARHGAAQARGTDAASVRR